MMKNTAKNGLPMRFELRECVLGVALAYGFEKNPILSEMLYLTDYKHREQVVLLRIPLKHFRLIPECSYLRLAVEIVKRYYRFIKTEDELIFFDTKKFRIYYQRLVWGREKKIVLDKTMQYFRTDLVEKILSEFLEYIGTGKYENNKFNNFWWYRNAKDPEISLKKYQDYIAATKENSNIEEYGETVIKKKKARRIRIG